MRFIYSLQSLVGCKLHFVVVMTIKLNLIQLRLDYFVGFGFWSKRCCSVATRINGLFVLNDKQTKDRQAVKLSTDHKTFLIPE